MPTSTLPGPTVATASRPDRPDRPDRSAAPVARRLRPPSWRDPRLLVGLLLVLASTLGGALVVRAADDTVPVFVARQTLTPGHRVRADDLAVAHVHIAGGPARYLPADRRPPELVVLRLVPAGELVPVSAVGDAADADLRPVAVPVDEQAAAALDAGALVDVWVARRSASRSDGFDPPRQVASGVQVSDRTLGRGAWGSSSASSVQLLLSPDLVPALIEAVDNAARVTLVPVPASLGRSAGERR